MFDRPPLTRTQQGILLVMFATLLFSSKGIFIKLVYHYSVEPAVLMFLRMLIALPVYAWVLLAEHNAGHTKKLSITHLAATAAFGFSGYYVASYLDLTGLVYLPASLERLVLYSYPSIVLMLSVLVLGRALSREMVISLVVVYLGLILVFIQDLLQQSSHSKDLLLGAMLVFGSAVAFAFYFIGSELMMRQLSGKLYTSLAMLCASLAIIVHFAINFSLDAIYALPLMVYFYAVLIAVFCTLLPSFMLSYGIQRIGAAKGSIVGSVGPVMTLILAAVFLQESISLLQGAGFVLVILGIWQLGRLKQT